MAYDTLKTEIRQYIQTNGQQEITGQILQNVLLDMVNAYPSLDGYATQQWVQNQNYLTSAELSGYATKIWVEDHEYVTSAELSSYATHTWVQSQLNNYLPLTGGTLTGGLNISDGSHGYAQLFVDEDGLNIMTGSLTGTQQLYTGSIYSDGTIEATGSITGFSFIKAGGTSSQFLKADGSVDNNTYLSSADLSGYATETWVGSNYLPLTGGTITGGLNISDGSHGYAQLFVDEDGLNIMTGSLTGTQQLYTGSIYSDGTIEATGSITGFSFIKAGGTSSQFLKADGSVDSNTYLTSAAISDMATQTWVGQQGFLTSVPSGYATETWVGNNYLALTGGAITSNLAVNGEFDTFSRIQVNGTSNAHPFIRLHIPNVNWARLQMDTDGVIHVMDGSHGTSYNGFACGNLNVNGTLKIVPNNSLSFGAHLEVFRSVADMLVVKNDDQDIVLGSLGNNYYVTFIEDIQGGTANSDYSMNTVNWGITTAGAATFVSVSQTSDIRRKNIISDIGMAIDDIAKAPMFRFTMKDDDEAIVRVGTSAQYWQTVIPEVVSEDKRGVLGLQYDVAALAGVITVAKRVVDHEARIAELEKENALLKAKLNIN